jgi:hypothetical protein
LLPPEADEREQTNRGIRERSPGFYFAEAERRQRQLFERFSATFVFAAQQNDA